MLNTICNDNFGRHFNHCEANTLGYYFVQCLASNYDAGFVWTVGLLKTSYND